MQTETMPASIAWSAVKPNPPAIGKQQASCAWTGKSSNKK